MIDQLILHTTTEVQIRQFIASPTHAVLITGPDGVGKTAIGEAIICALLHADQQKLAAHPHIARLTPEGKTISIESIRGLQRFLQLKTIGTNPYRRAVLIEHAGALTTEAQNAFLKLLEEPPADTLLVLTASSPRVLLPTIRSRLQSITAHPPTEVQLQQLLQSFGKDDTTTKQAYFLSGGLPGLLCALLSGDEQHPMLASVASAKEILQKTLYERLCMLDGLSKQKETAAGVLEALERIASTGLRGATAKQDSTRIRQWHGVRKATLEARRAIDSNVNAKLVLSNLFLHI